MTTVVAGSGSNQNPLYLHARSVLLTRTRRSSGQHSPGVPAASARYPVGAGRKVHGGRRRRSNSTGLHVMESYLCERYVSHARPFLTRDAVSIFVSSGLWATRRCKRRRSLRAPRRNSGRPGTRLVSFTDSAFSRLTHHRFRRRWLERGFRTSVLQPTHSLLFIHLGVTS